MNEKVQHQQMIERIKNRIRRRLRDFCFATACTVHKDGSVTYRRGFKRIRLTSAEARLIVQLTEIKRGVAQ